MRLPLQVATGIRTRKLIVTGQRVLVGLSGGSDSVALLLCLLELSKKRDLAFGLAAAHLHHGLRNETADRDEAFCRALCKRKRVPLICAFVDTPKLAGTLKRSKEETARVARHAFFEDAAAAMNCGSVAVAHHADDRIETVLYRLCRGTGIAGLQGIGWTGPVHLDGEPPVREWLQWRDAADWAAVKAAQRMPPRHPPNASGTTMTAAVTDNITPDAPPDLQVIRPFLGCSRPEILNYLRTKKQDYVTDETNFDLEIPRNAIRNLILPQLAGKVHPGARAALWRLAEEAEVQFEKRAWRREWLTAFARMGKQPQLVLPVPRLGSPPEVSEIGDALEVLRSMWGLSGAKFTSKHALALRRLFHFTSGPKSIDLPSSLIAERTGKTVVIRRNYAAPSALPC